MDLQQVLSAVTYVILDAGVDYSWYMIIPNILFLFGMWGIFRKCGLKPWHVLIPCLREITLGQAAGMAAAMAVKGNTDIRHIDIKALQKAVYPLKED